MELSHVSTKYIPGTLISRFRITYASGFTKTCEILLKYYMSEISEVSKQNFIKDMKYQGIKHFDFSTLLLSAN